MCGGTPQISGGNGARGRERVAGLGSKQVGELWIAEVEQQRSPEP